MQSAEARQRRFFASLEQPLESQADPEERHAAGDRGPYCAAPRVVEEGSGAEVTDPWYDDPAAARELRWRCRREELSADRREALAYGGQVARAIVNQGNGHCRHYVQKHVLFRAALSYSA